MECMCSICLDSLFTVNTDVSITPCGHLYHKNCIENSMQNNLLCPNCKTEFIADMVKKIHPDVFDELVYSDCSVETNKCLAEVFDYQKEKRIIMLKIIKKLDKENTSLMETNKSNHENIQTSKVFLKSFKTDKKEWQQKIKILELENNTLLDELRKVNNNEQAGNSSEDSQFEHINDIVKESFKNSGSDSEASVNEGLLNVSEFMLIFF